MLETDLKAGTVIELHTDCVPPLPDGEELATGDKAKQELFGQAPLEPGAARKIKIILVLFGVSSLLPWNLIINAAGFYKVKLTGSRFETTFPFYLQISGVFSNLIGSFSMFFISKKLHPRTIFRIASFTFAVPILVITILSKINTDTWQDSFFLLNLVMFAINAFSHGTMTSSQSILTTMINPGFLKVYYIGKGFAGLAGSAVAIVTLAVPSVDVVGAAFYYFLICTVVILIGNTALTFYFLEIPEVRARTCQGQKKEKYVEGDEEKEKITDSGDMSLLEITKSIKAMCGTVILLTIGSLFIFPATMTNLVPVNNKPETDWTEKFFLPIAVFLVFTIGDNAGKILSEYVTWPRKEWVVYFSIARLVLIPMVLMTNIQPRTLPVWFNTDVIPSLIAFVTAITGGHLTNLALAYAPEYVHGKENQGKASMIMFLCTAFGLTVGSACVFLVPVILNS